ncbi:MAG TPA: cysteine hydrolase [Massilia sp.]|nr:cysteine hydrolase [Massilia sp.]
MPTSLPALIVIDMQKCMAAPEVGERNNPAAERNIAALLAAWRARQGLVVHVRHISRSPDSPFRPGQPGVEFQEQFAPRADGHVVEKNVTDCFIHSSLERWLRVRGVDEVVIVGVSTNSSVEASARTAGNLGFAVQVVADATFAFGKRDYGGAWRSAEDVHLMALSNLDGEYARVVDTAGVLARLTR